MREIVGVMCEWVTCLRPNHGMQWTCDECVHSVVGALQMRDNGGDNDWRGAGLSERLMIYAYIANEVVVKTGWWNPAVNLDKEAKSMSQLWINVSTLK